MDEMKAMIVTRWERKAWRDPQSGRMIEHYEVTLRAPRKGEGWQKVRVDVSTPNLIYYDRENW